MGRVAVGNCLTDAHESGLLFGVNRRTGQFSQNSRHAPLNVRVLTDACGLIEGHRDISKFIGKLICRQFKPFKPRQRAEHRILTISL